MNEFEVSLVQGDPLFRLQQRLGLIPRDGKGFGLVRRAIFFALLAWLPIVIWAIANERFMAGSYTEPLLQHFGIHVRYLIAVPLLILGEGMAHQETTRLIPYFLSSGLVSESQRDDFRMILVDIVRLRNSVRPWSLILAIFFIWIELTPSLSTEHELIWATESPSDSHLMGFGGWWLSYVARPIFIALLTAWIWRLVLLFLLLKRIAKLNLQLVPTHPDRAGGLGFLESLPSAFTFFAFSVSSVVASRLAHNLIYHGAHVLSFKALLLVLIFVLVAVCLAPLFVFTPRLLTIKREALLQYGLLIGDHGRQLHKRWIKGEALPDFNLLDAPELGSAADTISLYETVTNIRPSPIGKAAVLAVAIPTVLPIMALFAIEVPMKDLLVKVIQILF